MEYHYKWYYCDSIQGVSPTYDLAFIHLKEHIPWIDDAHVEYGSLASLDDTTYFYETEKDSIDDDGSYTPSITQLRGRY